MVILRFFEVRICVIIMLNWLNLIISMVGVVFLNVLIEGFFILRVFVCVVSLFSVR